MKRRATNRRAPILLDVPRFQQPDEVTCGPTCLTQVFHYYGIERDVASVIKQTPRNPDGGTLAVNLGMAALRHGFGATIYSYNLRVFDPTWRQLPAAKLVEKLRQRQEVAARQKLQRSLAAYIEYLGLGGKVRFQELTRELMVRILAARHPILTGLSATYLYRMARELDDKPDDVRGDPVGHFVVICGYYPRTDRFAVCDPLAGTPFAGNGKYTVDAERLIASILLGDVTYDANLLVLSAP